MCNKRFSVYEYDLIISPVHWRDRGLWKCEIESKNGISAQSIEGSLDVEVPLAEVLVQSDENVGALVVDEHRELTVVCQTSPSTPAPMSLQILIGQNVLTDVQVRVLKIATKIFKNYEIFAQNTSDFHENIFTKFLREIFTNFWKILTILRFSPNFQNIEIRKTLRFFNLFF